MAKKQTETTNEQPMQNKRSRVDKKLTLRTFFSKEQIKEIASTEQVIANAIGIVSGYTAGESNYGTWTKLKGTFELANALTGESRRSNAIILPELANDYIYEAYSAAAELDKNARLEFALAIGVRPSSSPIGYEFFVEPLIEASKNDPLENIKKLLPAPS